jgi:hypothetical protein
MCSGKLLPMAQYRQFAPFIHDHKSVRNIGFTNLIASARSSRAVSMASCRAVAVSGKYAFFIAY